MNNKKLVDFLTNEKLSKINILYNCKNDMFILFNEKNVIKYSSNNFIEMLNFIDENINENNLLEYNLNYNILDEINENGNFQKILQQYENEFDENIIEITHKI